MQIYYNVTLTRSAYEAQCSSAAGYLSAHVVA